MEIEWNVMSRFVSDNFGHVSTGALLLVGWLSVRSRNRHSKRGKILLKKAIATQAHEPISLHPEIDPSKCVGCATCVAACPEGEVLKVIDHRATLVAPTKCVGHGECERSCPNDAIRLVFGTKTRGMDIPRISTYYETNVSGLYIAGELGGMGLIRNAVKQGRLAATHAIERMPAIGESTDVDLLIIGAGPAGLAAMLKAAECKARYLCIEQNSFGGTVYNFPRQKLVMSLPLELPLAGIVRFRSNRIYKEELLEKWNQLRARYSLKIAEHVRFEDIEQAGQVHLVRTTQGVIRARKVILATGVRGSPRRLGLPNEDSQKVAYNLIDPGEFSDRDICVVGGGNAGVEAALSLAAPTRRNRVTLLVRGPDFDRCNESNQNTVCKMAQAGQVSVWMNSSVKEIRSESLLIQKDAENLALPNEFLFVFAGAEPPFKKLMGFGVQIEKKFGEGLVA